MDLKNHSTSFSIRYCESPERGYPTYVVKGTPYEIGYYHVTHSKSKYCHSQKKHLDSLLNHPQRKLIVDIKSSEAKKIIETFHSQLNDLEKEELEGVNEGCKKNHHPFTAEEALIISEYTEPTRYCSFAALQPPSTKRDSLFIRNADFPAHVVIHDFPLLKFVHYLDETGKSLGYPFVNIEASGSLGTHTGINCHGMAVADIFIEDLCDQTTFDGLATSYMVQRMLMQAKTATEACSLLKEMKASKNHVYLIQDPTNQEKSGFLAFKSQNHFAAYPFNSSVDLSLITKEELKFYKQIKGALYWIDLEIGSRLFTNRVPYKIIHDCWSKIDEQAAISIARKLVERSPQELAQVIPSYSVICNLNKLTIALSYSEGEYPANHLPYERIDLKPFFEELEK